jgi:hypothetical protein
MLAGVKTGMETSTLPETIDLALDCLAHRGTSAMSESRPISSRGRDN